MAHSSSCYLYADLILFINQPLALFTALTKKLRAQDLGLRKWVTMKITAQSAGGVADGDDQVLEAGFCEGPDGSGLAVIFQRDLLVDGPWNGDRGTDDYFSNSYCITLGSGETVYGGLEQVTFSGKLGTFDFADPMAGILGIGPQLIVDFEVSQQDLQLFQETLKKIVTWGVPSQIPRLNGFN